MDPVSVYVVDDHAMVCDAIRAFLEGDPEIQVMGTETDPGTAMIRMLVLKPNVVLLDLKMPVHDGMEVLVQCKPQIPHTHFLALSGDVSTEQALDLVRAGASGVILKTAKVDILRKAVKCVAFGELWLERRYMADVVRHLASPRKDWDALSAREMEIVQGVVDGLSNREIGERLFISEDTVKSHLKVVFRKLHLESRGELAQRARARGIAPTP